MLVCVFLCSFAHETAGAACTRCSLRPLVGGQGNFWHSPDASRRGTANVYLKYHHTVVPEMFPAAPYARHRRAIWISPRQCDSLLPNRLKNRRDTGRTT